MAVTFGKILSLVIAVAWLVFILAGEIVFAHRLSSSSFCMGVSLLLPLALIWFPEQFGEATGFIGRGYVDVETPPEIVSFLGWFFLIGMPLILLLIATFGGA
jgi:hypothetical protein